MIGTIFTVAVCLGLVLFCFGLGTQEGKKGNRVAGVILTLLIAGTVYGVTEVELVRAAAVLAFLAGCFQALMTDKEHPPFEIVPIMTDDPDVGNWPVLFCLKCNIKTKAKRANAPDPPPPCPRCGKPLQG